MFCSPIRHTRCVIAILCSMAGCDDRFTDGSPYSTLSGDYHIISGERNGTTISPHELNNTIITITRDRIVAYDEMHEETFAATYTVDTNRTPWRITMISANEPETGVPAQGLLEVDRGRIRLIYALPNGKSPITFRTGEQQQMFVMIKD